MFLPSSWRSMPVRSALLLGQPTRYLETNPDQRHLLHALEVLVVESELAGVADVDLHELLGGLRPDVVVHGRPLILGELGVDCRGGHRLQRAVRVVVELEPTEK